MTDRSRPTSDDMPSRPAPRVLVHQSPHGGVDRAMRQSTPVPRAPHAEWKSEPPPAEHAMKALFDSASVTIERGDDTRVIDNREAETRHADEAKQADDAASVGHAMKTLFDSASVTIERGDDTRVIDRRALPQDAAPKQARAARQGAASTAPAAVAASPESLDFDQPLRPRASRVLLGWALALGSLALVWAYFA